MKKLLSLFFGISLASISSASFANACQAQVCTCPNGGYVSYGEWCAGTTGNSGGESISIPRDLPSVEQRLRQLNASQCALTPKGHIFLDDGKGDRERRMRMADSGTPYSRSTEIKLLLQQRDQLIADQQRNNTVAAKEANAWAWVNVANNSGTTIFIEPNTITYNAAKKTTHTLIKITPSPCYEGSSDQSCYNVLDYQFLCDKKQGAATRLRTYQSSTNQLLHDTPYDLNYIDIKKDTLLDHVMNAACSARK